MGNTSAGKVALTARASQGGVRPKFMRENAARLLKIDD